jgi:hypothetical protein
MANIYNGRGIVVRRLPARPTTKINILKDSVHLTRTFPIPSEACPDDSGLENPTHQELETCGAISNFRVRHSAFQRLPDLETSSGNFVGKVVGKDR